MTNKVLKFNKIVAEEIKKRFHMRSVHTHPVTFFFEHAGYSAPASARTREARLLHRVAGAEDLALCERLALGQGYTFEWRVDDVDSSRWCGEEPPYAQWVCLMYGPDHTAVQSLGGIDFGRESPEPWGKPYKRVVEAELALNQVKDWTRP